MKTVFFALPGNEILTQQLAKKCDGEVGEVLIRKFPDGETYIKIGSDVANKKVVVVCTLNDADEKIMPLYFFVKTAKELGAKNICLVAPYLAYMRQDKRFNPGEGITSSYFASFLSSFVDRLITIDPHLHRRKSLSEIYSIPSTVLHAQHLITVWIKKNIDQPLLVGPDEESEQWVANAAKSIDVPYIVLQKNRKGDEEVEVSVPDVQHFLDRTPVLVDDIISTAQTMMQTVRHLRAANIKAPVCIGIHAVFAGNAYNDLVNSGASKVITCNCIVHSSNQIDIADLIATELTSF